MLREDILPLKRQSVRGGRNRPESPHFDFFDIHWYLASVSTPRMVSYPNPAVVICVRDVMYRFSVEFRKIYSILGWTQRKPPKTSRVTPLYGRQTEYLSFCPNARANTTDMNRKLYIYDSYPKEHELSFFFFIKSTRMCVIMKIMTNKYFDNLHEVNTAAFLLLECHH